VRIPGWRLGEAGSTPAWITLLRSILMKTWWVLAWDTYYPSSDNFKESFHTQEEAEDYVKEMQESATYDHYDVVDISNRL
jgi:hypothetical protein